MSARRPILPPLLLLAVAGLAFGAGATSCASDSSADTDEAGGVRVEGAWARTSPMESANGAAYLSITSPIDDAIVDVAVDAAVAAGAEMHQTVMAGSDTGSDTGSGMGGGMGGVATMPAGQMTMQPVKSIDLPARSTVTLAPGGLHLMLIDLVAPLEAGDTIRLTLTLEYAGPVTVEVPVLDEAP